MEQYNETAAYEEISTETMDTPVQEANTSATDNTVSAKDVAATVGMIAGIALAVDIGVEVGKLVVRKVAPKIKAAWRSGVQRVRKEKTQNAAPVNPEPQKPAPETNEVTGNQIKES